MNNIAEEIERAALEDIYRIAPVALQQSLGINGVNIGSAFVLSARALPETAVVLNRAIGIGLRKAETEQSIRQIIGTYTHAGITRYFIQIHPEAKPAGIRKWLHECGLEKARGWQKFSRGREAVPPANTDLTIRKIGTDKGSELAAILCDAFDLGENAQDWIARLPACKRWHIFMTFDNGVPAGTGSVYIDGAYAWMDFGATAPQFRQRGSQSSLLRHRVQYALDHGCQQMFTCTGESVPGDSQHSYSNILKAGFSPDYIRDNYAPPRV